MEQYMRLVQHTLKHAAYKLGSGSAAATLLGGSSSLLAGGGFGSLGPGGAAAAAAAAAASAGGMLRFLHTSLNRQVCGSTGDLPAAPAPGTTGHPFAAVATAASAHSDTSKCTAQQQSSGGTSRHAGRSATSTSGPTSGAGTRGFATGGGRQRVAVGISGGVDSAVAAMLLQQQGYEVVGVFMRNWDESEETGNQNCSVERDLRDAAAVCRQLHIPLHEADFVSAYWNQVFSDFIAQCGRGLTPNPDLACNRHIKFDALINFAEELGAGMVATGHYARLGAGADGGVQLLRGADLHKDQSYFLASVQPAALRRVLFPVGNLQKPDVRRMAAEAGLLPADKRSSAGICFIGRRNYADFLHQYTPPLPGRFVDVDSGEVLGACPDIAAVTHGQRPGIGGAPERVYAVGKDVIDKVVYVAHGRQHPALLCATALLCTPHWLSPQYAQQLAVQGSLRCQYKARYGQQPKSCTIYALSQRAADQAAGASSAAALPPSAALNFARDGSSGSLLSIAPGAQSASISAGGQAVGASAAAGEAAAQAAAESLGFLPSAYCRLHPQDSRTLHSYLVVRFDEPAAAITPQQAFVLYDGQVCLGTALIALPGRSLHEMAAAAAAGGGSPDQLLHSGLLHSIRAG